MTREDISDIINVVCPNDEDYEKPCISPKYLRQELEQLALDQEQYYSESNCSEIPTGSTTKNNLEVEKGMTDYQKYINALRKCAKEHDKDTTYTGHIVVSELCRDTANLLETLEQEPTTKNNLAVREFEEIVVEYPPEDLCIYPEYKGKPYFSIKYKEGDDYIIGYGTYNPKVLSRYLSYFLPTVTPIRPKGQWMDKSHLFESCSAACSVCGKRSNGYVFDNGFSLERKYYDYCPNCGAKMVEPQESEDKE